MKFARTVFACLTLIQVSSPAYANDVQEIRTVLLNFHIRRTQPFYRGHAIAAEEPRAVKPGDRPWLVAGVEGDLVDERNLQPARSKSDALGYVTVRFTDYKTADAYDWPKLASAFPKARVAFELSEPRVDGEYAIVRLDVTSLRDPQNPSSTLLYRFRKTSDGWVVVGAIAPCCR